MKAQSQILVKLMSYELRKRNILHSNSLRYCYDSKHPVYGPIPCL